MGHKRRIEIFFYHIFATAVVGELSFLPFTEAMEAAEVKSWESEVLEV